ncbi:MAG: RNA methyltransferase [Bacteroidales bacterium]|nr:RNA methyltransferase [Bacteroidales bacterium]
MERISSLQNDRIKSLVVLQSKSRCRKESGLFPVEGRREISNCLAGGYAIESLFFCPEIISEDDLAPLAAACNKNFEVSPAVYSKISYREGTEGVVAVFHSRPHRLEDLNVGDTPFVVVLESVEKPGNLGAILRTADAADVAAVIVCDPLTDLYNPNLIRASMGGLFTVPVATCTSREACNWLKAQGMQILTAQLQDSRPYYDTDMCRPTAVVFGTESEGLTDFWRAEADAHILIPMLGKLDSLNVATSVAILSYEAVRQKQL